VKTNFVKARDVIEKLKTNLTLRPMAVDTLNRQLRSGISEKALADLVIALRDEGRLCRTLEEEQVQEPRIICSMGLSDRGGT
jgi:hypothetical protein